MILYDRVKFNHLDFESGRVCRRRDGAGSNIGTIEGTPRGTREGTGRGIISGGTGTEAGHSQGIAVLPLDNGRN